MDEGIARIFHSRQLDGLQNQLIGKKVYKYDRVSSTNDLAFMYAFKGEKEGSVFWARAQTKGRGRQGRHWISPKDKGLYFSIILRPDISVKEAAKITLLSALAICKALRKFSGVESLIKWPNDIVINNRKICGILTEMDTQIGRVKFIIVGIGVNTNSAPGELPVKEATSLRVLLGKEVSQENLLSLCLKEIDKYYYQFKKGGISGVIDEARHFSSLWGKQIKINNRDEGVAIDFAEDGSLVVRQDSGLQKHIFAGRVELLREK